ncbi:MAG: hypothetical protein AB1345_09620 [Chloroflexota bacterium]
MTIPRYVLLAFSGLLIGLCVWVWQDAPGYMDADYYYVTGVSLAQGEGFTETFLWNYLDDPAGLPHPSHAYWMPLTSLWAALGMVLTGITRATAARLGFLSLMGLLPPLTASLAWHLTHNRGSATLAGWLAVFPGFYLPYLPTTDTFGLYMLFGGLFFVLLGKLAGSVSHQKKKYLFPLSLGLIAGLMHLTRADGLLWIIIALLGVMQICRNSDKEDIPGNRWRKATWLLLCLGGYLLVMGPWAVRNAIAFGSISPPGSVPTLWLTEYDELYAYPASMLTPEYWWSSGWGATLRARVNALWLNVQTGLAVQGEIFLLPFILMGIWRCWKDCRVRMGVLAWLLTFGVMTVFFPFAGVRGGFFHSGAALQPLFWAVVPVGLEGFIQGGERLRGWQARQAWKIFSVGLTGLSLLLSVFIVKQRVIGSDIYRPIWNASAEVYIHLEGVMQLLGASPTDIVLVNNPPGYTAVSHRPAIVIPNGNVQTLLAVARRYGARYVLLEKNHPRDLEALYAHPSDQPGLSYQMTVEGVHIYLVDQ